MTSSTPGASGRRRDLKNFVSRISSVPCVRSRSLSVSATISPTRRPAQYASASIATSAIGRNGALADGNVRAASKSLWTSVSVYR